jgi:DNA-binding XRE family transcriptional regulator
MPVRLRREETRDMDVSMILQIIRDELAMTRADLARLCGVSPSTVGRIEKGELDPTWGTLTGILESTGYQLERDCVVPTGDATAAVAARLVLDHVLSDTHGDPPDPTALTALAGSEELQVWWERWRRTGWLSDDPTAWGISRIAGHAGRISRDGSRAVPHRAVEEGRRWRDLALRIDAEGFTYAVSDTAAGLEIPGARILEIPRIYVSDPSLVVDVLRLEESAPERGVLLVSAEWPELEKTVVGDAICFTSLGQALMDGLTGTQKESGKTSVRLSDLLREVLPRG